MSVMFWLKCALSISACSFLVAMEQPPSAQPLGLLSKESEQSHQNLDHVRGILEGNEGEGVNAFLADPKFQEKLSKHGPMLIYYCVVRQKNNVVTFLVEHGIEVNWRDEEGNIALHIAVFNQDSEMVRTLLQNGADVNARSWNGKTPLQLARVKANREIIRLLISYGAYLGEDSVGSLFQGLHETYALLGDVLGIIELQALPDQLSQALIFATGQRKLSVVNALILRQVHCYPALQIVGHILKRKLMPHVRTEYDAIQKLLSEEYERWQKSIKQPVARKITQVSFINEEH